MSEYSPERLMRSEDAKRACQYGIPFLDDALNGIRPTELVILGGKTGAGKTQLGSIIALNNVANGKRVLFVALEAEQFEIERRLKFQIMAKEFYARRGDYPATIKLTYTDWLFDKYGKDLDELDAFGDGALSQLKQNLTCYSPNMADFSKRDFSTVYESLTDGHDLVVFDHIHYLAQDDKEHEYEHIKKTMWQLRNDINRKRVPIIAMSHLRKEDKKDKAILPAIEELHGSSEITKQANHVVVFAPVWQLPKKTNPDEMFQPPVGSTLCRILKTRSGHSCADRYAALMKFNLQEQHYDPDYVPYEIDRYSTTLTPMRYQDFEFWMGKAREPKS